MLSISKTGENLRVFANDIQRKAPTTQKYYLSIARKFMEESGDLSRPGIMTFMNGAGYCDNSLRAAFYVIKHLCKALDVKFPLDKEDLPPLPDDEDIYTPTMTMEEVTRMINYWKEYPGSYPTALLYMSTIWALRAIEMTTIEIHDKSVTVHVAKRRTQVIREHPIWGDGMIYLCGYEPLSEKTVGNTFWKICRKAGVKRDEDEGWHSIRRGFATIAQDNGVNPVLVKRYMRWARERGDMASMYYHKPFADINEDMKKCHPFLGLW